MSNELSGLIPFGIGIVAITKPDNVDTVMFFPPDKLSFEYGKVDEIKDVIDVEVADLSGKKHKVTAERGVMLEATWLPGSSDGRQTAPDVVNGETIEIYRYKDSKTFFWRSLFREPGLRRLEHVVHAYSNLPSGRKEFDKDSSYGSVWSTKEKKVSFWTSQSNGEAFAYEFKIDTANSTWSMWDNVGNGFGIESTLGQVYMRSTTGAFLEITEDKGSGNLPGGFDMETPKAAFSDTVTVGKKLITPKLILGGSSATAGSVPVARLLRMAMSDRVYKQDTEGYDLTSDTGMVIGDNCLFEMGHQSGVELGRDSHLSMQEQSSIEIGDSSEVKLGDDSKISLKDNSEIRLGSNSEIILEEGGRIMIGGRDLIAFLRTQGF